MRSGRGSAASIFSDQSIVHLQNFSYVIAVFFALRLHGKHGHLLIILMMYRVGKANKRNSSADRRRT
jgi:hypothetical protein